MFISNSHKFIFVHLHKCAGTSVEKVLSSTLQWNDILSGSTPTGEQLLPIYMELFGLHKHSSAQEIKETVGTQIWGNFFTFSTVRNPYSLTVSQFTFAIRLYKEALKILNPDNQRLAEKLLMDTNSLPDRWPFNYPAFNALLSARIQDRKGTAFSFSHFIRSNKMDNWNGFMPQILQLCDKNGTLLVDKYIKVEELDQRWPEICSQLKLDNIPLPRSNTSTFDDMPHFSNYYTNQTNINYIRNRFKDDFAFFNYSDQLPLKGE